MAWLSTWYLSKPISHHKPEGLDAPAQQYLLSRHTVAPDSPYLALLQLEELLEFLHRLLGPLHRVPDRPGVLVDLVVVAALERLVAEEVDRRVGYASRLLRLGLEVLQAVGLVPAGGEDVEGDLTADGEAVWREDGQSGQWFSPSRCNWAEMARAGAVS